MRGRSGYCRGFLVACGGLYFILTLFGAVKWSLWRDKATNDAVLHPADFLDTTKLLAVVVPTHAGDLEDAVVALSKWPNICSAITRHRMQLVLYYSGGKEDKAWSEGIIDAVEQTGGRCFQRTRVVFAQLDDEVTVSGACDW